MNNKENIFVISVSEIQEYSLEQNERELTKKELELLEERLSEDRYPFIQENLDSIIEFSNLLERNKDIETTQPHYIVKHKNENAFQDEFKEMRKFRNRQDAEKYIKFQNECLEEEWKIEKVK